MRDIALRPACVRECWRPSSPSSERAHHPPGPKASYFVNAETPADADDWLRAAEPVQGSWWEDWAEWASARSGERVAPPSLPECEPAPGRYVHG